jgi:hypothetical protein
MSMRKTRGIASLAPEDGSSCHDSDGSSASTTGSVLKLDRYPSYVSQVIAVACEPWSFAWAVSTWPPSTLTVLAVRLRYKLIAWTRVIQKYLQKDLLCRGSKESNLDFPFRVWLFELVKGWPSPVRAFEISQGRAA